MIKGIKFKYINKNYFDIDVTGSSNFVYYFASYMTRKDLEAPGLNFVNSDDIKLHWMIINLKNLKNKGWVFADKYSPIHFKKYLDSLFTYLSMSGGKWYAVTVPSHDQLEGNNNLGILFTKLNKYLNIQYCSDLLLRKRIIPENKKAEKREYNVNYRSLTINPKYQVEGQNFILLDDVVTTGKSIIAARDFLLKNKANKVICVALTKTFSMYE